MILTREQLNEKIKTIIGDRTDDEALSFLEDVTDTINDIESKAADPEDWKSKYEELDKTWKTKYKERFFSGSKVENKNDTESDKDKEADLDDRAEEITIDDLFEESEV